MHNAALTSPSHPAATPPTEDREFDAWLRNHLAELHAAVLAEPVPERFLRILKMAGLPGHPAEI